MFEAEKDRYEFHLIILSVKMKVKFPCKMKIQHLGSLITGQIAQSDDNRYIFNQQIILKDEVQKQFFQLTVNLITEKGAKYIAGVIKIYQSQLIRSEGQRLVLSLSKCIDSQAFCQIRVDQTIQNKRSRNVPFDKKSMVQLVNVNYVNRQLPYKNRDADNHDFSPMKPNLKGVESRSQFNFPINPIGGGLKKDWDSKSRGRLQPPQTVYQKSYMSPIHYPPQEAIPYHYNEVNQGSNLNRQKALEAEVYKQGYQKLKQKYKKQAQISKSQLNKRLALQNSQNNLKLEIMRYKIKIQQLQKSLNDKTQKLKDQQTHLSNLQQKQIQNSYLKQQINKNDNTIRILQDKSRNLLKNINEMKEYSAARNQQDYSALKDMEFQYQNLKNNFQSKEREYQKQTRSKMDLLQEKQFQLNLKKQLIQRQKKINSDLQKSMQVKSMEFQKLLQYQKNNQKTKIQENKSKIQKLEKQLQKCQTQKKDTLRQLQQLKNITLKTQYQKKIMQQQLQNLKHEFAQSKIFKQKYSELYRQTKSLQQQKLAIQKQIDKIVHNKDYNIAQMNKQYQEQIEYLKRNNRDLDQKARSVGNKLIEVEGQLEISRNQHDKARRNLQSLIKEAAESKEKQKNAKKGQKSIQQEYSSMQSEMATLKQKLKSIDHIHKLQLQKVRQQSQKLKIQLQNQQIKVDEFQQSRNQQNMELSRLKIKLQYAQEKIDKDAATLKQKQNQIQNLIKDYQEQISSLDNNINILRGSEKEYSTKIQKYEIDIIKLDEKVEKSKKQIKIFQQKIINYQSALKSKNLEFSSTFQEKQKMNKKNTENQDEINRLKIQNLGIINQKNKNTKIIQLLQEQVGKLKNQISNLNGAIIQKQKKQENLNTEIKKQKDEFLKLQFKFVNLKKQGQKNKQLLNETITKYLSTLTMINKQQQKKNFLDFLNNKSQSNNFSDLINLIIYQTKDIKQIITKQIQQNRQLSRQNERLHDQASSTLKNSIGTQQMLKKQIQQLEKQLSLTLEERDQGHYDRNNIQLSLNQRIRQLQGREQELSAQIQELTFTINSLKMDYQAINDQNLRKLNNLRRINQQYQQKVQQQLLIIQDLDQRCNHLQTQLDSLNQTHQIQSEITMKKDKYIDELKSKEVENDSLIHELKKNKKELSQKCSELELYLHTEKQINDKLKISVDEEQKKSNQFKLFITNLMKQKQMAIKSQLERSQANIHLQSDLLQCKKQIELLKDEKVRLLQSVQTLKEQIKKHGGVLKQLEMDKNEEKLRYGKLGQKLKQKEKELILKDDTIKKHQSKLQKLSQKYRIQKQQIQEQIDFKTLSSKQQLKLSNDKILTLQSQLLKKQTYLYTLQQKYQSLNFQLLVKNDKLIQDQTIIGKLKQQNQELLIKINGLDISNNQLSDELKEKQEKLFECSGKIYNLETRLQTKEYQLNEQLQQYHLEFSQNNQKIIEEYEQRLQLVEKERDYYQGMLHEKDKEILKLHQVNKGLENSQYQVRKGYEERLKKLEEQKLSLFTLKNNQIHRLLQENTQLTQISKERQTQSKRVANELEVARKTILNLDIKVKDFDQKIKGVNKIYQLQMQQLKKKDVAFKNFKETVNNYQWNLQRQIKKLLQIFIKNSLEIMDDRSSQKSIELARALERSIIDILSNKIVQK